MRVFHGTVNIAGIGGHLSRWQRANGIKAQFVTFRANRFFDNQDHVLFPPDISFVVGVLRSLALLISAPFRFDIFHFYGGRTLMPLGLDLPFLRLFGRRVIMTYCGSEARQVWLERKRNPYWKRIEPIFEGTVNAPKADRGKRRMMRWHRIWCHRVIAPRNLYDNVANYFPTTMIVKDIWIHNLSTADRQEKQAPDTPNREIPVVIHAPSSPEIKGTEHIRAAVRELQSSGVEFQYVELQGQPHQQVLKAVADADIVIDQLLIGGFGSLSVEGMSLGRPVICYLIDEVREDHYPDCPIANASIDTIAQVLRQLIDDQERRVRLGAEGQAFVKRHMDYDDVNRRLIDLYRSL